MAGELAGITSILTVREAAPDFTTGESLRPSRWVIDQTRGDPEKHKQHAEKLLLINVPAIIIGATIFIVVIVWYEVIRSFFEETIKESDSRIYRNTWVRFLYAIFVTIIGLFVVYLIYGAFMKPITPPVREGHT